MNELLDHLASALERCDESLMLVVTGAGVSRASGIATFRGSEPEAVWRRDDMELATVECFHEDPVRQWRWYLDRFAALAGARPNPAHQALVRLERWQEERGGGFLLLTQNIDTLHEQAGSRRLVKVHGTADRLRCARYGCAHGAPAGSLPRRTDQFDRFVADPRREHLPTCPTCGDLLRAHVLFFDEYYQEHRDYRFTEAIAAAETAAVVVFAGTSFSVGITDLVLRAAARRRVPVFSIDPGAAAGPSPRVRLVRQPAEVVLPQLCERLGARPLEAGATRTGDG